MERLEPWMGLKQVVGKLNILVSMEKIAVLENPSQWLHIKPEERIRGIEIEGSARGVKR